MYRINSIRKESVRIRQLLEKIANVKPTEPKTEYKGESKKEKLAPSGREQSGIVVLFLFVILLLAIGLLAWGYR
jgi:hypothetical protein